MHPEEAVFEFGAAVDDTLEVAHLGFLDLLLDALGCCLMILDGLAPILLDLLVFLGQLHAGSLVCRYDGGSLLERDVVEASDKDHAQPGCDDR